MGSKSKKQYNNYLAHAQRMGYNGPGPVETIQLPIVLNSHRVGDDQPHFRQTIESGGNATNAMVAQRERISFRRGYVNVVGTSPNNAGTFASSSLTGVQPEMAQQYVTSSVMSNAQNKALIRILKKIREEQGRFSGPTFLGELRDAIRMIRHPAKTLGDSANKWAENMAREAKNAGSAKHKVKRFKQVLSESWLENAFGWQPLMSDIGNIAESSLERIDEKRIIRLRGFASDETATESIGTSGVGYMNVLELHASSELYKTECQYLVGVWAKAETSSSAFGRVIADSRFDLSEVIPTAWELIPWSFLADYFTNIGDVLGTAFVSRSNVAWVCRTTRTTNTLIRTGQRAWSDDLQMLQVIGYKPARLLSRWSRVVRESADLPIPEFRFELPGRLGQFANIAALMGARSKGRII